MELVRKPDRDSQGRMKREMKICFLGQFGVGKTSLVNRLVRDRFSDDEDSTIGAAFNQKHYPGRKITLQIWDTAGQDRYRSLIRLYYREAGVCIVVVSVERTLFEGSFKRMKEIMHELGKFGPDRYFLLVVLNKCDTETDETVDDHEDEVQEFLSTHYEAQPKQVIRTSARTGLGISVLEGRLVDLGQRYYHYVREVTLVEPPKTRKRCPCWPF